MSDVLSRRASGVLLHPTSLPGDGIGTLGREAYRFVDWLVEAGQSYWQILPLVAVDHGGSPYNGLSALAGNPLLVDLDALADEGLLDDADAARAGPGRADRVDFRAVIDWKIELLRRAFRSAAAAALRPEVATYRRRHAAWLDDYALFRALRDAHGQVPWTEWPAELRDRRPQALARARRELADEVDFVVFQQFLFDRQWSALREYANARGVGIIGDIPIFVAHDSADVWAHPEIFELDEEGRPRVVSGVPPDYFSETGQRWGNPLYRWGVLRDREYDWWVERFRRTLEWVDVVRIDHFRGFQAYWEIPASEETAIHGQWCNGPGADFFRVVRTRLDRLPVIAEDLGLITEEVEALRDELRFPGMRVIQFGFSGDPENPHLPENYPPNAVVYTGTHDNDTVVGWWEQASSDERRAVERLLGPDTDEIHWKMMRLVFDSHARLAVVPVQDVLGLGSEARMNTPGTSEENWSWRLRGGELTPALAERLRRLTEDVERVEGAHAAAAQPETSERA